LIALSREPDKTPQRFRLRDGTPDIEENWGLRPAAVAKRDAPPDFAVQTYMQATMTEMIAHCTQGGQSNRAITWASDELEGFMHG